MLVMLTCNQIRRSRKHCKYATKYNKEHGGKQWKYVLLPHDCVERTFTFIYNTSQKNQNNSIMAEQKIRKPKSHAKSLKVITGDKTIKEKHQLKLFLR